MQLKERYNRSFVYWQDKNDGGWQDWFNRDIPGDLAYPAETEFIENVVSEMLEAGETYWHHPGWIRDTWKLFSQWAEEGRLIRVRLFADWLLSTLPAEPLDSGIGDRLARLANGEFSPLGGHLAYAGIA